MASIQNRSNRTVAEKPLLTLCWKLSLTCFCYHVVGGVQSLSRVWLFAPPWTAAHQASLSLTISRSSHKFMSIESWMPSTISSSTTIFSFCCRSFAASGSSNHIIYGLPQGTLPVCLTVNALTSHGGPRIAGNYREPGERRGAISSSEFPGGTDPANTLILCFW